MNEREFCYWLKGFFEMANPISLGDAHTLMIKKHLDLVFKKVTPELKDLGIEKPVPVFKNVKPHRDDSLYGGGNICQLTCSAGDIDYGEVVEYGATTMPLSCSSRIGFV